MRPPYTRDRRLEDGFWRRKMLKKTLVGCAGAALLSFGLAGPADAQQEGLVNVNITDVEAAVPIGILANVCGVNVNVLSEQLDAGGVDCTADAEQEINFTRGTGGSPNQRGLVNVNISDLEVAIPVAVIANICDVNVSVLAALLDAEGTDCSGGTVQTIG
jgi:hypothetical protein